MKKAQIVVREKVIGITDDIGLRAVNGLYASPIMEFSDDTDEYTAMEALEKKYAEEYGQMRVDSIRLVWIGENRPDKLKMHTPNLVEGNIEKIAALFPNVVTERIVGYKEEVRPDGTHEPIMERAIDFDTLRQELSDIIVEGPAERYAFTWPDKRKSVLAANAPIAKTLRPCREESVDFDTTENLYIEGDNLDALKLMLETYLGMIKLIYIDPPYNTGSDFVYEDDFAESTFAYMGRSGELDDEGNRLVQNLESNGRFHTDWLNMLYPRLKLAKDLLSEDGVIVINMDENEIANLQKICDEVFGSQNSLGVIVWDKRNPKGDAHGVSYQHEYILLYARDVLSFLSTNHMQRPKKNASAILKKASQLYAKKSSSYSMDAINRDFASWIREQPDFSGGERAYNKIDDAGEVYRPVSMAWPNKKKAPDDYFIPLIHPVTKRPCPVPDRGWRNPSATMRKLLAEGRILFGSDESTIPNSKYLLKDNMYENIPSLLYYGGSDTDLLAEMSIPFDTPKVVAIVREHINALTEKDSIVLDFFSGSSTTAHAVLQSNAEDGGHRKFIMVQLPEVCDEESEAYKAGYKNICEIGKERIRRAGAKIKADSPLTTQDLDVGFRVLKVASSNMRDVYYSPDAYEPRNLFDMAENIKEDRTPEDLLFQVMLDLGVLLSSRIEETEIAGKKVFRVANGYLVACFDSDVTDETVKAIAQQHPDYAVFRDSGFRSDSTATNFEQIFATYRPSTIRKVL